MSLPMMLSMILLVTLVPAVNFFPLYYRSSPWRSTDVGRAMMGVSISMALLIDGTVVFNLIAAPDWAEWAQVGIFALSVGAFYYECWVLIRKRRDARREVRERLMKAGRDGMATV